jgi:AsmA protein
MKRVFKVLLVLVSLIIVLGVAALLAAFYYLDPNLYKEDMIAFVRENTGRELRIDGDIEKSFYPRIGIRLNRISLGNPPGFGTEEHFFQIEQVRVGIKLMPLFHKRVEVEKVTLSGLSLHLIRNAKGEGNWADFQSMLDQSAEHNEADDPQEPALEEQEQGMPQPQASEQSDALDFKFEGFELVNASFRWTDLASGQDAVLSDFNIFIPLENLFKPFPVKLDGRIQYNRPLVDTQFSLNMVVSLDETLETVRLDPFALTLLAKGDALPREGVDLQVNGALSADTRLSRLEVADLQITSSGVSVQGDASLGWMDGLEWNARLETQPMDLRALAGRFGFPLPEMRENASLTHFKSKMGLEGTLDSVKIDPLDIELDQSRLTGEIAVVSMASQRIRFNLALDKMNVDQYLPPPLAQEGEQNKEDAKPSQPVDPALLDRLRKLDIEGRMTVGQLTFSNLQTTDAEMVLVGKDGVIRIDPFQAKLYQGTLQSSLELDARQNPPKTKVVAGLQKFQAGPFTEALLKKERVRGEAMLSVAMDATGMGPDALLRSLNGKIGFEFRDGAISGINIARMIRSAQARLAGKTLEEESELETDFALLSGTITAQEGVLTNQDLHAASPLLRVSGKGRANLVDSSVDYTVVSTLVGTTQGQGGRSLDELVGLPIPIRVKGSLLDPSFSLDLKAALTEAQQRKIDEKKEEVRTQVEEKKEEAKERLEQEVKERLPGVLRGIIGR